LPIGEIEEKGDRKLEGEGRQLGGVNDFLKVEVVAIGSDAIHGSLAVEGKTVTVIRFRARIKASPGESLNSLLEVVDPGLDIGEAVGFLLGGFKSCG